ncbi:MAG TPA: hypothetical protein VF796_21415 [Humisphaera sp.]
MGTDEEPTLSQALVRMLRDLGLTNVRIGHVTGVSASEMTRIVKGEREFKANQLVAVERWLGIPLCAVLAKAMQFLDCRRAAGPAVLRYVEELTREAERCLERKRREMASAPHAPAAPEAA